MSTSTTAATTDNNSTGTSTTADQDKDIEFPDADAFATAVLAKIHAIPALTIDRSDLAKMWTCRELSYRAINYVGTQLAHITERKIIADENASWEDEYDKYGTRAKLVGALQLMHKRETDLNNIFDVVQGRFTQLCHRRAALIAEVETMLSNHCAHGSTRYNSMYVELLNLRKAKLVKNLGLAAPFEYRNTAATGWKGKLVPPKGFAKQFNEEFKERLPVSEQDEKTATARQLVDYKQGGKLKWVPWVLNQINNRPDDELFEYMYAAELIRKTYAPKTQPFSCTTHKFYTQQLASPHWFSLKFIDQQLRKRMEDEAEAKAQREIARKEQLQKANNKTVGLKKPKKKEEKEELKTVDKKEEEEEEETKEPQVTITRLPSEEGTAEELSLDGAVGAPTTEEEDEQEETENGLTEEEEDVDLETMSKEELVAAMKESGVGLKRRRALGTEATEC